MVVDDVFLAAQHRSALHHLQMIEMFARPTSHIFPCLVIHRWQVWVGDGSVAGGCGLSDLKKPTGLSVFTNKTWFRIKHREAKETHGRNRNTIV